MKRIAITLCIFLLLGAVVNVAVAWGSARLFPGPLSNQRWYSIRRFGPSHASEPHWVVSMSEMTSCTTVSIHPESWYPKQAEQNYTEDVVDVPVWSRARSEPDAEHRGMVYFEEARGWPALSLMWRVEWMPSDILVRFEPENAHVQGAVFGSDMLTNNRREQVLPYMPIWPGFAINTLFYAAILWLLFTFPFALRRWRRIRRGLCAKCAYPFGASDVCTECGAVVTPRS